MKDLSKNEFLFVIAVITLMVIAGFYLLSFLFKYLNKRNAAKKFNSEVIIQTKRNPASMLSNRTYKEGECRPYYPNHTIPISELLTYIGERKNEKIAKTLNF